MDHRHDKNNHMLEQLFFCPKEIPINRFSGLSIESFLNYDVHDYIKAGSQFHKGVIGCWMSHKQIIKQHIEKYENLLADEWTLILEDDVIISPEFWTYVQSLNPPDNADMVFFNSGNDELLQDKYLIDEKTRLYKIYSSFPDFVGTHCYAIRNSILTKLYSILDGVTRYKDIDGYYFYHKNLITYNYQTKLIRINHNFKSDRLNPI